MDVCFGFVVNPVKASLHRQPCQHAVFITVTVRGGNIYCSAFIVQRFLKVIAVLIPALSDPQLHTWPQNHDGDGQRIQLVLTALQDQTFTSRLYTQDGKCSSLESRALQVCFIITKAKHWPNSVQKKCIDSAWVNSECKKKASVYSKMCQLVATYLALHS